jgi:hypothetical protein
MQEEIHGDIYVVDEQFASDGNAIVPIRVNVINLDEFLNNTHPHEMPFINLPSSRSLHWSQQAMEKPQLHLETQVSNEKE